VEIESLNYSDRSCGKFAVAIGRASSFSWHSQFSRATLTYDELLQNPVFDPGGRNLHIEFRGGQAELSEDR